MEIYCNIQNRSTNGASVFLWLFLFSVFKVSAQEKKITHSFSFDAGVVMSGEWAIYGINHRVSSNLFTLQYQRSNHKRSHGFIRGNTFSISSEILSGFYIPVLNAFLDLGDNAFYHYEDYAPSYANVLEGKYLFRLNQDVSVGVLFGYIAFAHPIIYLNSKLNLGVNVSLPKGMLSLPFASELGVFRTLLTPTGSNFSTPSPYNVIGVNYRATRQLTKKNRLHYFIGLRYLKLLPPGSLFVSNGGHAYRIDTGFRFVFSKTKEK